VPATILHQHHLNTLRDFLCQDITANLFGLGILEQNGIQSRTDSEWWGMFDLGGQLQAACYAGAKDPNGPFGLLVPIGDPQACITLGLSIAIRGGGRWAVGERTATDSLWEGMGNLSTSINSDQCLYELTEPCQGKCLSLRFATENDRQWVTHAATEMMKEDFGINQFMDDDEPFHRDINAGILSNQEFIGETDGQPVFRIKISTLCSYGAQLGGTWVDPAFRGKGTGQAGMRAAANHLLAQVPRVTLHVREKNATAIGCYSAIGFEAVQAFRLLSR
jgi:ribosomal protein S18 acetylase RimI-like enzyme